MSHAYELQESRQNAQIPADFTRAPPNCGERPQKTLACNLLLPVRHLTLVPSTNSRRFVAVGAISCSGWIRIQVICAVVVRLGHSSVVAAH